jgi:hypothetical protein
MGTVILNQVKFIIGGPETLAGSGHALESVVPLRGTPTIDKKPEFVRDPVISGINMKSGSYVVVNNVAGGIPLAPRACAGFGKVVKSILGSEVTPVQIGAMIRFRYTGASASCKIVANATDNTIIATKGVLGAETADTDFGTGGTIDCDTAAYDTVDELVAAIEGYASYTCEKIFEQSASYNIATNKVIAITNKQAKNTWCYVLFASTTSGVYAHEMYFDPTATTEHGTYTTQLDGKYDNFLYVGGVVNTLKLNAALKGLVEADAEMLGMTETIGQTASVLTLPDNDPLIFHTGSFSINEDNYTFIRNMSLDINQNQNPDGYGQGSTLRQYHQRGECVISGDAQVRLDATAYALRADMLAGTRAAISYYFKGNQNFGTTSIPEMMLVELPYCTLTGFEFPENNGVFDAKVTYDVDTIRGTRYNQPITITLLTTDTVAY